MARLMELNKYKISTNRGFLPSLDPVLSLPKEFGPWEDIAARLPELIRDKSVREEVEKLPTFSVTELKLEEEWWRAFCLLAFVSHSYVWCEGKEGVTNILPKVLAVPWCEVARHLDMPPVITHACITLYNWRKIDPNAEISRNNITTLFSFTGSKDEEWFCVNTVLAEKAGADIVTIVPTILQNCKNHNTDGLIKNLCHIENSTRAILESMKCIRSKCNPAVFFNQVFGYLAGWGAGDALPDGLVYEGVGHTPEQHAGGNPSQSSVLATLDALLGINHTGKVQEYFMAKEHHMIKEHRLFLRDLKSRVWLRDYVKSCGESQILSAYNNCIELLAALRSEHIKLVCLYVVIQKNKMEPSCCPAKGTSGDGDFVVMLKTARNNTLLSKLNLKAHHI